jgi:hypothetical protein
VKTKMSLETSVTMRASRFRDATPSAAEITAPSQRVASEIAESYAHWETEAPESCCRTGHCQHWVSFDRRMILARLRWNLTQNAHDIAERLRRDGLQINPENLRTELSFAIANAQPRSAIVPWHLPDAIVEKAIEFITREFTRRSTR